ncbi:MAG: ferrous iron transport protein A [Gemmatimonadetes bacterium]|nr:FeoA family protein [Gemmatimonadota bacterium]MXX02664.1 ferrous iron transport protein A [Gemmatimonadota bacterium]MXY48004.1 ferrous iron transport protein A [Gemmatimonadota bacterium]MYD26849.1 ferrous iron transport protein A [Gemmatimonadota bacterium]MYG86444.1 ferrous iron transport protein A [Gemmatimonadota bacterium]
MYSEIQTSTAAQTICLDELKPGEKGTIRQIKGTAGEEVHLMELGLLPGTSVVLIKRAPMGDPIEIRVRNYHLSIRCAEARSVMVERG